jgi:WD40 repeat protein
MPVPKWSLTFAFLLLAVGLFTPLVSAQGNAPVAEHSLKVDMFDMNWSPDGQLLAVATSAGVKLLNTQLAEVAMLQGHTGNVVSVTWKPDGTELASAGGVQDGTLRIWQRDTRTNTFSSQKVIPTEYNGVPAIAWSPDGKQLAMLGRIPPEKAQADEEMTEVQIWDAERWTIQATSPFWYAAPLKHLVWSPDSTKLAGGGKTACFELATTCPATLGGAFILDAQTAQHIHSIKLNFVPEAVEWSAKNVLAVSSVGGLQFWDTTTWQPISRLLPNQIPNHMTWNKADTLLAVSGIEVAAISILDVSTGERIASLQNAHFTGWMQWSPDGTKFAGASADGVIQLWDVSSISPSPSGKPTLTPLPTLRPTETPTAGD